MGGSALCNDTCHDFGVGIVDQRHSEYRNKFGPSVSINHFNPIKIRYPISRDWHDNKISAKNRNDWTKFKIRRACADSENWYQKRVASKRVDRNKEYMAARHSSLIKYNRRDRHIEAVLRQFGF